MRSHRNLPRSLPEQRRSDKYRFLYVRRRKWQIKIGKITQVIGAVLDLKFSEGYLPEINDAVEITRKDGGKLVVEVAQHLGDDIVRCIAMGPTDGLVRGMDAVATGGPISVPVGEATLGRIFNVLGEPIDEKRGSEGC